MQYTGFTDGSELKIEGRSPPTSPRIHTLSEGEVEALVDRMYELNLERKESVTCFMLSTKNMGDLREVRDLRDENFRMSPATVVCIQECKMSTVRALAASDRLNSPKAMGWLVQEGAGEFLKDAPSPKKGERSSPAGCGGLLTYGEKSKVKQIYIPEPPFQTKNRVCHVVTIVEFFEKMGSSLELGGGFVILPIINMHWWYKMAKGEQKEARDHALADLVRLIIKYSGWRQSGRVGTCSLGTHWIQQVPNGGHWCLKIHCEPVWR